MDHGADAINVTTSLAADVTKGAMKITAEGLRQLLLVFMEAQKSKIGEISMLNLINSLEAGDQTASVVLPDKLRLAELQELAQNHGITYAVIGNKNDEAIIYYKVSQEDRMHNVLQDMAISGIDNEPKDNRNYAQRRLDEITNEDDMNAPRLIAMYDRENPKNYIEILQTPAPEGKAESSITIYRNGKMVEQGEHPAAEAANEMMHYANLKELKARGVVTPDILQKRIQNAARRSIREMEKEAKDTREKQKTKGKEKNKEKDKTQDKKGDKQKQQNKKKSKGSKEKDRGDR